MVWEPWPPLTASARRMPRNSASGTTAMTHTARPLHASQPGSQPGSSAARCERVGQRTRQWQRHPLGIAQLLQQPGAVCTVQQAA
jgi:hypothetical protein